MNRSRLSNRRLKIASVMSIALVVAAGCGRPSFLVTMVSDKPGLVETVLSRDSVFAFDKIAIIDVTGTILNAPKPGLFGGGENPVALLLEQLDKARRDHRVKGVILRINSPGGGVVATRLMYDEIKHFKKSGKPIIAIMMDVAASGGYYIACACDDVVAQPSTITGSIGVRMQLFDLVGTMKMIGVTSDAIISGKHKDSGSLFREMRPEERELFQNIIDDMFDRFVDVVVEGREQLDEPAVRTLADGRIYTATQAVELGLIDRIATLRETIASLKERVGARNIRVVAYGRPLEYRPNYYAQPPHSTGVDVNLINVDLSAWMHGTTPQFLYLWQP